MRGEGGVAGEGRVVGVPKLQSWGKCTMPLTQIGYPLLPLACVLTYIIYIVLFTRVLYFTSFLGCNVTVKLKLADCIFHFSEHNDIKKGRFFVTFWLLVI